MLEVLRKNGLTETAAVVTRYFGGIKLGAGGLVRAYSGSVAGAVAECGLAQKILMSRFSFLYDVNHVGRILNVLYQQDLFEIADVVYDLRAKVILKMRDEQKQEAEEWLTEHLNQKIELEPIMRRIPKFFFYTLDKLLRLGLAVHLLQRTDKA